MNNDTISLLRDSVRTFNKHVLNPPMLKLAGHRHWYAASFRHTGRCSGRSYATPVVAERTADGFLVPLPYGTGVDWLRNSIAHNGADITKDGQTYHVSAPHIVDADTAASQLSMSRARTFRRFGIREFAQFTADE